jgi:hypothetical protein
MSQLGSPEDQTVDDGVADSPEDEPEAQLPCFEECALLAPTKEIAHLAEGYVGAAKVLQKCATAMKNYLLTLDSPTNEEVHNWLRVGLMRVEAHAKVPGGTITDAFTEKALKMHVDAHIYVFDTGLKSESKEDIIAIKNAENSYDSNFEAGGPAFEGQRYSETNTAIKGRIVYTMKVFYGKDADDAPCPWQPVKSQGVPSTDPAKMAKRTAQKRQRAEAQLRDQTTTACKNATGPEVGRLLECLKRSPRRSGRISGAGDGPTVLGGRPPPRASLGAQPAARGVSPQHARGGSAARAASPAHGRGLTREPDDGEEQQSSPPELPQWKYLKNDQTAQAIEDDAFMNDDATIDSAFNIASYLSTGDYLEKISFYGFNLIPLVARFVNEEEGEIMQYWKTGCDEGSGVAYARQLQDLEAFALTWRALMEVKAFKLPFMERKMNPRRRAGRVV